MGSKTQYSLFTSNESDYIALLKQAVSIDYDVELEDTQISNIKMYTSLDDPKGLLAEQLVHTFQSSVDLCFKGNQMKALSIEEYKKKVEKYFKKEFNFLKKDLHISNIVKIDDQNANSLYEQLSFPF